MTFAGSILLLVVGAILRFAVHVHTKGFNLHTVGLILMIAGAVGLIIAFWQWATLTRRRRSEVVVDDRRRSDGYRDPRY